MVRIGLCSTDGLYHASGALDVPGAMFTASHNPADYNGIKLCRAGARPVGEADRAGARSASSPSATWPTACRPPWTTRAPCPTGRCSPSTRRFLRSLVDLSGIRPLKVVVDAGNGMAGLTVPAVLGHGRRASPSCRWRSSRCTSSWTASFPNHEANPLEPENLRDLQAAVVEHGADLGLAFDGDADRCFVVDENGQSGEPVGDHRAGRACVRSRREVAAGRTPTVIHNLITSRAVPDLL